MSISSSKPSPWTVPTETTFVSEPGAGPRFRRLLSEQGETCLDPIREQVRRNQGRIRAQGADRLVWALLDAVVDGYFVALEQLGSRSRISRARGHEPRARHVEALHYLKRRLLRLRKAIWPLREVSSWLELTQNPLLGQSTRLYFRDLHDHVVQAIDMSRSRARCGQHPGYLHLQPQQSIERDHEGVDHL